MSALVIRMKSWHGRSQSARGVAAVILAACLISGAAIADDEPGPIEVVGVTLEGPAGFREQVLPILRAKCLACHSASKKEGGLVLETAESIRKGGDSGPAVVAGKPDESVLAMAAGRRGDVSPMPPLPNDANAAALTPQELGMLTLWIREGARDSASAAKAIHWQPLPPAIDAVYSLALDPQEQFVAAGRANRLHLYDIVRQRELAVLSDPALGGDGSPPVAHRDIVSSLAFSPDGTWLASGGYRIVKLWKRSDPLEMRRETGSAISRLALSTDGHWLAAGLEDGGVRLWDRQKNADGPALKAHDASVAGLAFNVEGTRLLSASGAAVRLWDLSNAQQLGELATPAPIRTLLALADGVRFATGHEDGVVRVWAVEQFGTAEAAVTPTKELKGHSKPVTSLAWVTAEGPRLLSGSEDGTLRQWDLEQGKDARQIAHGSPVTIVAAAHDGSRIASAGTDGMVRVWDARGQKLAELSGDPRPAAALGRAQADQTVAQSRKALAEQAVTQAEKDVKEREESLKKGREQVAAAQKQISDAKPKVEAARKTLEEASAALTEHPDEEPRKKAKADAEAALAKEQEALKKAEESLTSATRGVELSQKSVAAVQAELAVRKQRRDAEGAQEQVAAAALAAAQEQAKPQPVAVTGLAFAPDGTWLAVADQAGRVVLWRIESKRALDAWDTESHAAITALASAADGRLIAGTTDGHVDTWRGEPVWTLAGHLGPADPEGLDVAASPISDRVLAIDFSPDGTKLAVGGGIPSRTGQLQIWDLAGRTVSREFPDAHSDTVFSVAFSRDGTVLASGAADKFAKVFDVGSGELIRNFEGHTGHVLSVAWKADGSLLATAGADNAIKIWTTATGEQQRTITSHRKPVTSVAFVGIEEKLVSAGGDNAVLMHTVSNGRNYRRLDGSTDFLHALVVSRDESRVVAGCDDGTLRVWDGTNGKLLMTFGSP